jgi:glutathione-regulated potassium-efflux system ancillary protein KefF
MNPANPANPEADILVIAAHPTIAQSRVNRLLLRAARHAGPRVVVRDLYALYPDYLIDVEAEQRLLAAAKLVVWQHPIHWYGMTPLMKLWVDEVLSFGWAYGPGGTALRGKDLWLVASTGSPQSAYRPDATHRYFFDAFLPPYEQTAALCGMRFLPPLLLHGAHRAPDAEVEAHLAVYADRLRSYPRWPELDELLYQLPGRVPEDARPADDAEAGPNDPLRLGAP